MKLILAAGSVLLHIAFIEWIVSNHSGMTTHPTSAQQLLLNVSILSPDVPQPAQPLNTVAATAPAKAQVIVPLSIVLPQQRLIEKSHPFYFPFNALDRGPLPKSEPDLQQVKEKSVTNLPIRLRIFIDRFGVVDNVVPLDTDEFDRDFVNAVADVFRATSFLPGRINGNDVPTFVDIEVGGNSVIPYSGVITPPCSECAVTDHAHITTEK